MRSSKLESILRRFYRRPQSVTPDPALEDRLLRSYDERYAGSESRPSRGVGLRWAVATAFVVALGIGACTLPADYEVEMGNRLGILVDGSAQIDPRAIVSFVEHGYELTDIDVRVRREREVRDDAEGRVELDVMRIELDLVGPDVDVDQIWDDLVESFPELEGARMEGEALQATVHGTVGGLLSHEVLDVIIDRHGAEEAERRILEDLRARGIEGEAHVEVTDEDGKRRVQVRVEAKGEDEVDHKGPSRR